MNTIIYLADSEMSNLQSPLSVFFLKKDIENVVITSSFQGLSNENFSIFTGLTNFIINKIMSEEITNYAFILSGNKEYDIDNNILLTLSSAKFVHILGGSKKNDIFVNLKNVVFYKNPIPSILQKVDDENQDKIVVEESNLATFIEYVDSGSVSFSTVYVLGTALNNKLFWDKNLKKRGMDVVYSNSNISVAIDLITSLNVFKPCSLILKSILTQENTNKNDLDLYLKDLINTISSFYKDENREDNGLTNIVCYKPTYLFKDLVERFVDKGCVHSNFPLEGYKKYIWMRPQEIWHIEHILRGIDHSEISQAYKRDALKNIKNINIKDIKASSVAIHHGTCFQPLYQFDPYLLAKSLFDVKKVVGVCEIAECYGPSYEIANKDNFTFVPIGYDDLLFNKDMINKFKKEASQQLNIGFVGRAYGTKDYRLLEKSKLAEPKGYRKGGDILFNILTKLKLKGIDFKLHILGQNWEDLVEDLQSSGIDNIYYARDKNITYKEYPSVYSKFDALLISARCEGGPVSAIEALSLGVPIVSTDVGVVNFLNKSVGKGVYVYPYNKKWHIADIDTATEYLTKLYSEEMSFEDRCRISSKVQKYTTDYWVNQILKE